MKLGWARARSAHRGLGAVSAAAFLAAVMTGLGLQHPDWLGTASLPPVAVAVDPASSGRLLRLSPWLLEVSEDGGITWRESPALMAPQRPVALVFAPAETGEAWMLGASSLAMSRDGGRVWSEVPLPAEMSAAGPATGIAVQGAGRVCLVGRGGGWLRGPDGTWTPLWVSPRSGGDRLRELVHDLHTGRWGPGWMPRAYDAAALVSLVVLGTGLALLVRPRARRRP